MWLSQAQMTVGDRTVAVARTWHIATGPRPPIDDEHTEPPKLPPAQEQRYFFGLTDWGYGDAIEWRFTEGGYDTPGRAGVWTRVRPALIAGEPITPLARTLIVADSANGLSSTLPIADWWSIPPGMTTTLMRPPTGEWVHLACHTRLADDGIGLAHGGPARRARIPRRGRAAAADPATLRPPRRCRAGGHKSLPPSNHAARRGTWASRSSSCWASRTSRRTGST